MASKKDVGLRDRVEQLERRLSNANDALEAALSAVPSAERDNNFFTGGLSSLYEGRSSWDRKKIFAESMRAWRVNPIARRIVRLITSFVVGKGLSIKSDDPNVQAYLSRWWKHPQNNLSRNVRRWKDEDTRTGNLFFLITVLADGMAIVRGVPSENIEEIKTLDNDVEQELGYYKDSTLTDLWPAYDPQKEQVEFMLHYASNQPVGSAWGEADLSPLLVWIGRYSAWLEDRVRLNRFRTAFMYVIRGKYDKEADRAAREKELNGNPPKPGSVLVMNANNGEDWGILSASLDSFDASVDGVAIKRMFATGVGFPMHWLSEPESSTRTTAEAAGTPSFRTLEETQNEFFEVLVSLARVALRVAGENDAAEIWIEGPDITERDNAALALALGRSYPHLADMLDRDAVDEKEFMRLVYKQFAEVWDGKVGKIKRKPLVKPDPRNDVESPIEDDKKDETDPEREE